MDIFLQIVYGFILLIVVFGIPIGHLANLLKGKDRYSQIYQNNNDYSRLATLQILNGVFLLLVFLGFWLMLTDKVLGTFNGLMLAPFLIVYILLVINIEKKIDKLPRNNRKRWE